MSYWKSRWFSTLLAAAIMLPLIFLGLNWIAIVIAMVIATVVTTGINIRIGRRHAERRSNEESG